MKELKKQSYITPLISFEEIENDNDLMDAISAWAIDGGDPIPIIYNDSTLIDDID